MGVKADLKLRASIVLVLAFALASPAWSDTIILRDGTRVSALRRVDRTMASLGF